MKSKLFKEIKEYPKELKNAPCYLPQLPYWDFEIEPVIYIFKNFKSSRCEILCLPL